MPNGFNQQRISRKKASNIIGRRKRQTAKNSFWLQKCSISPVEISDSRPRNAQETSFTIARKKQIIFSQYKLILWVKIFLFKTVKKWREWKVHYLHSLVQVSVFSL